MNEEIARKQLIGYINEKIELTPEEQLTVANAYHLHQVKKKDFFVIFPEYKKIISNNKLTHKNIGKVKIFL